MTVAPAMAKKADAAYAARRRLPPRVRLCVVPVIDRPLSYAIQAALRFFERKTRLWADWQRTSSCGAQTTSYGSANYRRGGHPVTPAPVHLSFIERSSSGPRNGGHSARSQAERSPWPSQSRAPCTPGSAKKYPPPNGEM
ncbi:hypothetical protein GCM10011399_31960 [Subtercola lobariae]|uniref:Uncharacterized protein n=1 Tax=Subtercola lobariae TaxID=1588641 RepID=A0A917BC13_9MICO|nr:hypothetical protein GCM10011399_31960 [Subtercola lobariae]